MGASFNISFMKKLSGLEIYGPNNLNLNFRDLRVSFIQNFNMIIIVVKERK